MLLTPTAIGALLAGAAFWWLLWVTLYKLEEIPVVEHWLSTNRCLSWVKANPSLTLAMREATSKRPRPAIPPRAESSRPPSREGSDPADARLALEGPGHGCRVGL